MLFPKPIISSDQWLKTFILLYHEALNQDLILSKERNYLLFAPNLIYEDLDSKFQLLAIA